MNRFKRVKLYDSEVGQWGFYQTVTINGLRNWFGGGHIASRWSDYLAPIALNTNKIYAVPLYFPKRFKIKEWGVKGTIENTGGTPSFAIGLYRNSFSYGSNGLFYPDKKLSQASWLNLAPQIGTHFLKTETQEIVVQPNQIIWGVIALSKGYVYDTAFPAGTLIPGWNEWYPESTDYSSGTHLGFFYSWIFSSTLPDPFPSGADILHGSPDDGPILFFMREKDQVGA